MKLFGRKKSENPSSKGTQMKTKPDIRWMLYARFDIKSVKNEAYGEACYKILFRSVPLNQLTDVVFFMGDRGNTCVIGMAASKPQLELIHESLNYARGFIDVATRYNSLEIKEENQPSEPVLLDGVLRPEGFVIADENGAWAEGAFNDLRKKGEI